MGEKINVGNYVTSRSIEGGGGRVTGPNFQTCFGNFFCTFNSYSKQYFRSRETWRDAQLNETIFSSPYLSAKELRPIYFSVQQILTLSVYYKVGSGQVGCLGAMLHVGRPCPYMGTATSLLLGKDKRTLFKGCGRWGSAIF